MNETMVYADGFEKTFATAEEMLDFLSRRGKASEWIRKPIRALRLVPLEKEAGNLENGRIVRSHAMTMTTRTQRSPWKACRISCLSPLRWYL